MMDKIKLRLKIERLRRRMYNMKDNSRRLRVSQDLDRLINEYMKNV
ncbi:hypothetical protein DCCM_4558 [Desulfocucumis palustris]|uniref:Spo0E like sporulation regulatory protein n=1 Tax=Desulfocucumis palustris TaxID=1898651 RepID=A0A2L2XN93_9FIRM|nr:aspartyl-phosphate phosphatase Spo0E family protein [Desulfocucumis palustris]GBF35431.1 hypothetical protein DCCM_4558 [Desulfocucumis palustris]